VDDNDPVNRTVSIKSALLRVNVGTANSARLINGYSYQIAYANRKALLASIIGVFMVPGLARGRKLRCSFTERKTASAGASLRTWAGTISW